MEYTKIITQAASLIMLLVPTANDINYIQLQKIIDVPNFGSSRENLAGALGIIESVIQLENMGLLIEPKYIFLSESFDDFIDYSQDFYNKGMKKESGALVGVVLENIIKNIAEKNGIERKLKVDQIISALTRVGIINKSMATRMRSWYNVRNRALHADWDSLEMTHIGEAINGCRELISNYL
ncbi:hypothetical protein ISS30_11550 [bacterium]|nr:hypothetical protein [bacterium]